MRYLGGQLRQITPPDSYSPARSREPATSHGCHNRQFSIVRNRGELVARISGRN
jgi:hypothetical protein